MNKLGTEKHGENVGAEADIGKPKNDKGLLKRTWKGPDGEERIAWQAYAGKTPDGKRIRKQFETKAEARTWLYAEKLRRKNEGHAAMNLTDRQRLDAVQASELLTAANMPDMTMGEAVKVHISATQALGGAATILEAVRSYAATVAILEGTATPETAARYYRKHKAPVVRRTVGQVIDEHLADSRDRNVRPTTLRDLEHRMGLFREVYGDRLITEITRDDVEKWIRSRADKWKKKHHAEMSNITKKNYQVLGGGLFNFAIGKEYVTENPFTRRTRARHHEDEKMPECLTWQDVTALLNTAAKIEPNMVAPLAIGCFAGLRTAELRGMDWKDINLAAKRITVMPHYAKKRRARHVTISDNLAAWLLPHREQAGFVAPQGDKWRFRFDHVRRLAKTRWPSNGMRHAFASHHLAMYGDPARTAFELGHHRDTSMLFDHYRALVTKEDAEAYWAIMPTEEPGIIRMTIAQAG
ncbi:MAG: site-specific integrase [bacterium]